MADKLRVLFVASEVHPLKKTGGLADVAGALPAALTELGHDVRILMPAYPGVTEAIAAKPVTDKFHALKHAWQVEVLAGTMPGTGIPVYLVNSPQLYLREGNPYTAPNGRDWPDNAMRFGVFSKVAAMLGSRTGLVDWHPDIVHCNDWQSGLTPAYMYFEHNDSAHSLMSIHNLAYQGSFPEATMRMLDLPASSFSSEGVEFYGKLSFMKAGIYYADHVATVSPQYAREIRTPTFGYGLEGLLQYRGASLSGILNGIDTEVWNPAGDALLPALYSAENLDKKRTVKKQLLKRVGLQGSPQVPLIGMVGRMTWQKGFDVVMQMLPKLMAEPVNVVLLGSGDPSLEDELALLESQYPGRLSVNVGYNEELAHWIEAGSDMFLMPSRFEPCGLNQMYSMRYGTPPVARHTGGLADSITDTTPATLADGSATGFHMANANADELYACLLRALLVFNDTDTWKKIQLNGMRKDFSWAASAARYDSLYAQMMADANRHVN